MTIAVTRDRTLLSAYGLAAFAVVLWGATPAATKVAVSGATATVVGDLLCVGSSALAGLGYVAGSRLAIRLGAFSVTFWGIAIAGVIQAPLAWWLSGSVSTGLPTGLGWAGIAGDAWIAVLYLALASSILGYLAWYKALADGGAVRMAPMQFAMPVISLALAVAWLGDAVTPPLIFACAMVLAGIALSRRR